MKNLYERINPAIEKIEFLAKIVRDWAMNPAIPTQWSEDTAEKAYAGMERILSETAKDLKAILEEQEASKQ